MTTRRQSTTAKITRATLSAIAHLTAIGEGIIIRFSGKEYGATRVHLGPCGRLLIETWEGITLDPKRCTIRKATVQHFATLVGGELPLCYAA